MHLSEYVSLLIKYGKKAEYFYLHKQEIGNLCFRAISHIHRNRIEPQQIECLKTDECFTYTQKPKLNRNHAQIGFFFSVSAVEFQHIQQICKSVELTGLCQTIHAISSIQFICERSDEQETMQFGFGFGVYVNQPLIYYVIFGFIIYYRLFAYCKGSNFYIHIWGVVRLFYLLNKGSQVLLKK